MARIGAKKEPLLLLAKSEQEVDADIATSPQLKIRNKSSIKML